MSTTSFRPLAGIMVLIRFEKDDTYIIPQTSFRPLAGIMVLIVKMKFSPKCRLTCFRPLAGIMVLITLYRLSYNSLWTGFRPLAGIMVLIWGTEKVKTKVLIDVSVPLRGLWFLSWRRRWRRHRHHQRRFRPLAGIMVLIILLEVSTDGGNSKCFRPLAGIMVLIGARHGRKNQYL